MYTSLEQFVDLLAERGELVEVGAQVDPYLEIREIADRMSKAPNGGKALLFRNTGTEFPLLINMFGSERRMALALGAESLDAIPERIDSVVRAVLSPRVGLWQKAQTALQATRWLPRKSRRRGACQQVVWTGNEIDLGRLPILFSAPCDGGRFITLPMVNTVDPATGVRNVGMYRMQVMDRNTTAMHWQIHKTGERHYRAYQQAGTRRMPVSVCLGGDPAYTFAATAPMPDGMDEYLLAGFLRGKPVKLVKCLTNDIYVPEDCDFVIEGWVDTTEEKVVEGPFGDHTGFYSLEDRYPLFHVTAITHHRGAIYPATIVGVPPMEDAYIAKASERIFLAPIRLVMQPEIRDMWMPEAGVAHNLAVVSIAESYAGQARKVGFSLLGAGQMMFTKYLAVVPETVAVHDIEALAERLRRMDVTQDIQRASGVYDALDHATATPGVGGKLVADLTIERGERPVVLPREWTLCGGVESVDCSLAEQWSVLIVRAPYGTEVNVESLLKCNNVKINFVALFDSATEGLTPSDLLWIACGDTEPERDVHIAGATMILDCRTKVGTKGAPVRFPNIVTSDEQTRRKVDSRWEEYGIGEHLPSPSDRLAALVYSSKATVE
ncbi:MAG: menaquinone biosynthesis decarboxylase [Rikenellaceae bacterium]|nr:menaquinone biosynthesis decarboxylase [Rikenellaceae bacterium]